MDISHELVLRGDQKVEERTSWSTEKVAKLMDAMDDGAKIKSTPFYEGNPILRRGNILFDYTDLEIQELYKCANDICYFANNFCTVMTDEGLQTITLRDYQVEMLRHFQNNRFTITLASRQIGKCFSFHTKVKIKIENEKLKKKFKKFKSELNIYNVPFYELYYAIKSSVETLSVCDNIKYVLYKTYSYLS